MPHGANLSNSAATLPGGNPTGQGGTGLPARARHPVWQDRHHWRDPPSRVALAALDPIDGPDVRGMPDGTLLHLRDTYPIETAWAPPWVGDELRQVRAADAVIEYMATHS